MFSVLQHSSQFLISNQYSFCSLVPITFETLIVSVSDHTVNETQDFEKYLEQGKWVHALCAR